MKIHTIKISKHKIRVLIFFDISKSYVILSRDKPEAQKTICKIWVPLPEVKIEGLERSSTQREKDQNTNKLNKAHATSIVWIIKVECHIRCKQKNLPYDYPILQ